MLSLEDIARGKGLTMDALIKEMEQIVFWNQIKYKIIGLMNVR
jgi:hypothetical protein